MYIRRRKIELEPIISMSRIGLNTQKDTFLVYVNPTEGGGHRYIKVYDNTTEASSKHVIRLSFDGNEAYDHHGKPLWEPSKVPFKTIHAWMGKPSDKYERLTNWQTAIYDWNYELGFKLKRDFLKFGTKDENLIDNEVLNYRNNRQFVRPDTPKPQWDKNISIRRLG
jgi:hypothetical protein